jgi:hypothetical protein
MLQEELFYLLAPRPVLGIRGTREPFRPAFEQLLRDEWGRFDATDRLELRMLEGGHEYFVAPAIQFLRQHL